MYCELPAAALHVRSWWCVQLFRLSWAAVFTRQVRLYRHVLACALWPAGFCHRLWGV